MARKILRIDASLRGDASDSRRLTEQFLSTWLEANPDDLVLTRDIADPPLPHMDGSTLAALFTPEDERNLDLQARTLLADELMEEFLAADVLVLGVPMYNFGIPSVLKAWVDYIARAGVTFRYTSQGPEGLAGGKQVYILSTRGGVYEDGPLDHQVAYMRTLLGFLGIDDIRVIQAEGLNISPDSRERALEQAQRVVVDTVRAQAHAA